ncbi:RCC1 domain-containing protein [Lysobacter brunescens]|uniref:non-specific serine/threonine protein kinase n=1 Tax=Lysobacter brunescens TaxID=262323 RepID=A0ABW2YAI6_9GAMM
MLAIILSIVHLPSTAHAAANGVGFVPLDAGVARNCNIDAHNVLRCWRDDVQPSSGVAMEGRFIAVSVAVDRTCAIRTDGLGGCWSAAEPSVFRALPFGPVIAIDATSDDVCAVASDGRLRCVGGELSRHAPNKSRYAAVSVAPAHACALRIEGGLDCWGKDEHALADRLPHGHYLSVSVSETDVCAIRVDGEVDCARWGGVLSAAPPSGMRALAIAAGSGYACAIVDDGRIRCWGDVGGGLMRVPSGRFVAIGASEKHACVQSVDGEMQCWGNSTRLSQPVSSHQDHLSQAILDIAAGEQKTCVLRSRAEVDCAGIGVDSPGTTEGHRSIAAGTAQVCSIADGNRIVCWGSAGKGDEPPPEGPMRSLDAGAYNGCAIRSNGLVACWGWDKYGQDDFASGTYRDVATGMNHSCAIRADASLVCRGYGAEGQTSPPAGGFRDVDVGERHACALSDQGRIVCWGLGSEGQTTPSGASVTYRALAVGAFHACAISDVGRLACWGRNNHGQATPPSHGRYVSLSAGFAHSCAIRDDGQSVCWGDPAAGIHVASKSMAMGVKAVDTTPPTVTPVITGTLGENGWYVSEVQLRWLIEDPESPPRIYSGCRDVVLTQDTKPEDHVCMAVSDGSRPGFPPTTVQVVLKRDTVPPRAIIETPAPNEAGWYNSTVGVRYTCFDETSGVPSNCNVWTNAYEEGPTQLGHQVKDEAGHLSEYAQATVWIDKTPPTISAILPTSPMILNASFDTQLSGTDARSGVDWARSGCTPIATQIPSQETTCRIYDRAGNLAAKTGGYAVLYDFEGFMGPLAKGEVLHEIEATRYVPIIWKVRDAKGVLVADKVFGWVEYGSIACPAWPVAQLNWRGVTSSQGEYILPDGSHRIDFRFYADEANKCFQVHYYLRDQTRHTVTFKVRPRQMTTGGPLRPIQSPTPIQRPVSGRPAPGALRPAQSRPRAR